MPKLPSSTRFLFILLLIIFGTVLIRTAWVCDDAYISFRSVDNFAHGAGLRWNVDERVQSFTSPLWVLVITVPYKITGEMYFTVIFFSIGLTLMTLALIYARLAIDRVVALLIILVLVFSKAFVDYSTSGLENVLIHLLLIAFFIVLFRRRPNGSHLLALSVIASALVLTRMDVGLLLLPALVWEFWQHRSLRSARLIFLGFLPFIVWELFSVIYYGFPLPNTFYAKTQTGIPQGELMAQSFMYYLDAFQYDPITIATIVLGVVTALMLRTSRLICVALGMILYLLYTIAVGCDFMLGRFLTAPLVCALAILSQMEMPGRGFALQASCALILLVGLTSPCVPLLSDENYGVSGGANIDARGIADERAWYYQQTGLLRVHRGTVNPDHEWSRRGTEMKFQGKTPVAESCVGFTGFFAGPAIHIIDGYALTEPLLARLPCEVKKEWRIGHFARVCPAGYMETLKQGKNLVEDSLLAQYVDHLRDVTRGPLFSLSRFKHVMNFNLGRYDTLLCHYVHPSLRQVDYEDVNCPQPQGMVWNAAGNLILSKGGMSVALDSVCHQKCLEISIDHNDNCTILYFHDSSEIAYQSITRKFMDRGGLRVDTLEIPRLAWIRGFDRIDVRPWGGDDRYSIGHLRFIEPQERGAVAAK